LAPQVLAAAARRRLSDRDLERRAAQLSATYLDSQARPDRIEWSSRQTKRWGSATRSDGSIRLSEMLREAPAWVLDYVLYHELVHLVATDGHGPRFQELLARYPHAEMAQGFLRGLTWAGRPAGRADTELGDAMDDAAPAPLPPTAACPLTLF
jgi:predicted metal-dependent hydrolase